MPNADHLEFQPKTFWLQQQYSFQSDVLTLFQPQFLFLPWNSANWRIKKSATVFSGKKVLEKNSTLSKLFLIDGSSWWRRVFFLQSLKNRRISLVSYFSWGFIFECGKYFSEKLKEKRFTIHIRMRLQRVSGICIVIAFSSPR